MKMNLASLMNKSYSKSTSSAFYNIGEIIELIVYDKKYPSLKEVDDTIKFYKELGKEEELNHKLLGITYKVAVINRKINIMSGEKEPIDYSNLKIPVVTYITSFNPKWILNKAYGVKSVYTGLDIESDPSDPKTIYLLPAVSQINKQAKESWKNIIEAYDKATEEEVIRDYHNVLLQKQHCIVNIKNNKFVPIEIAVGTTFISKIYSVKERFFNITNIEWMKDERRSKITSMFNSKLNENTVRLAKQIKQVLETKKNIKDEATKEEKRSNINEIIEDEDDDGFPFDKF